MGQIQDEMGEAFKCYDSWGRWLDEFGWGWFATLTFRNPKGWRVTCLADRIVQWGHAFTGRGCCAFVCSEHGKQSGRYHLHGLINVSSAGCRILDDQWRKRFGFSNFRRFQQGRGAAHYVGKYILKSAFETGEYTFAGAGPGFEGWEEISTPRDEIEEKELAQETINQTFGQKTKESIQNVARPGSVYRRSMRGGISGYDRYLQERDGI